MVCVRPRTLPSAMSIINVLVDVARFAIAIGRPDHVEALGCAIPDPGRSARVLVSRPAVGIARWSVGHRVSCAA
jgi:hypothetical protein